MKKQENKISQSDGISLVAPRKSIARKVTRYVSIMLLVAFSALFIGSYAIVYGIVKERAQKYSMAIVTVFADLFLYEAERDGYPVTVEHPESVISRGEYVCTWYGIDYAYVYVPDIENGTIRYIAVTRSIDTDSNVPLENYRNGYTKDYVLTDAEMTVWNGEEVFGFLEVDNELGHEYETVVCVYDKAGNKMLAGVDLSMNELKSEILGDFLVLAAIIVAVFLCVHVSVFFIVRRYVSKPAGRISRVMEEFISDGKRSDIRADEEGSDEYSAIARAFNKMSDNIGEYVKNIETLSKEKEYENATLEIASRIQRGFLPKNRFSEEGYEINTVMIPAKNVGGDLYDYLQLDGSRVLVVIGDVSGKGIAASLFMAITLMTVRQYARMNLSPGEILRRTNDSLSENNAAMLFATAFVGIYDRENGSFTYSNAGHNKPFILGKTVRTLDAASGTVLGYFENETYEEEKITLSPGETVFLYTDGVNESTDRNNLFFGEEKLKKTLEDFIKSGEKDPVSYVNRSVFEFSRGSEQHDDITMLSLTAVNGGKEENSEENGRVLYLDVDVKEIRRIQSAILSLPIHRDLQLTLCLCAEERFVNICSYAYPDGVPEGEKVKFTIDLSDRIVMRFEDGGVPFDPTTAVADPDEYDIDTQIGGLGNFITFAGADEVKYKYENQKNILILTKNYEEERK